MRKLLKSSIAVLIVIALNILCVSCSRVNKTEYTWEEFEALNIEQQLEFQNSFESDDAFEEWVNSVKPDDTVSITMDLNLPWENGGKSPDEYTWNEFEALDSGLQIAFQSWFDSYSEFETWMQKVKIPDIEEETKPSLPWENGGKSPDEYTWDEFNKLSGVEQIFFQKSFDKFEDFEKWMDAAQAEN